MNAVKKKTYFSISCRPAVSYSSGSSSKTEEFECIQLYDKFITIFTTGLDTRSSALVGGGSKKGYILSFHIFSLNFKVLSDSQWCTTAELSVNVPDVSSHTSLAIASEGGGGLRGVFCISSITFSFERRRNRLLI